MSATTTRRATPAAGPTSRLRGNPRTPYANDDCPGPIYPGCMARLARAVAAGVPHHVMQRGNPAAADLCRRYSLRGVPGSTGSGVPTAWRGGMGLPPYTEPIASDPGFGRGAGPAPRPRRNPSALTGSISRRDGWVGHLWQGPVAS